MRIKTGSIKYFKSDDGIKFCNENENDNGTKTYPTEKRNFQRQFLYQEVHHQRCRECSADPNPKQTEIEQLSMGNCQSSIDNHKKNSIMKTFLRKSFLIAIALVIANLFLVNNADGQIVIDQFTRSNSNTVGNGWTETETTSSGAQINTNQLQLGSTTTGKDYIIRSIFSSNLNTNTGVITWMFNMRQSTTDPGGFASGSTGLAFVLASSGTDLTTRNGYAVALGQSGSADALRLVRFAGGLDADANLTNIISGSDFANEYLAVKVTYDPSNDNWQLFEASNASSFPDPLTATYTQIGSSTANSTYTGTSLPYLVCFWNHSNTSSVSALFDNIYLLTAGTSFSGAVLLLLFLLQELHVFRLKLGEPEAVVVVVIVEVEQLMVDQAAAAVDIVKVYLQLALVALIISL